MIGAGVGLGLGREVGSWLLWFQESLHTEAAATHHFDLKSEGVVTEMMMGCLDPRCPQMLELKGFLLPFVLCYKDCRQSQKIKGQRCPSVFEKARKQRPWVMNSLVMNSLGEKHPRQLHTLHYSVSSSVLSFFLVSCTVVIEPVGKSVEGAVAPAPSP